MKAIGAIANKKDMQNVIANISPANVWQRKNIKNIDTVIIAITIVK